MTRYKISENIDVVYAAGYSKYNAPVKYQQHHYILSDRAGNRDYLINETVKYFLDKFTLAKTKNDVIEEIASDLKSDVGEIKNKCASFFNFLCMREVLVPEGFVHTVNKKVTLYQPGESFEEFEVEKILGNKRNVDVYLVNDKLDNRKYVIKLVNPRKAKSSKAFEEEVDELEKEFGRLVHVQHIPRVCQAYELRKMDNGAVYIRLEYVQGLSLSRFLKQRDFLPGGVLLKLVSNIIEAFSLLHINAMIHGDIHSSNILVGEDFSIKIIDLGLSIDNRVEAGEVQKIGGVNFYMPPERINMTSIHKFSAEPDYFSDVYQIGLLIYLVVYKLEPFTAFIWEDLALNIKNEQIDFNPESWSSYPVPAALISIMKKCLQKNPLERYENAQAIGLDFKKC